MEMQGVILKEDARYPSLLKKISKDAPLQLYYKGEWDEQIFENCLAVVGSRQMTSYGKRVVERVVTGVASAGITIVSGFMYGVDATAHKMALLAGGRTIAVMPCGIDLIHPEYQLDLYTEILKNKGLIISEYEGKTQPVTWTYPRRNRIVAGLSPATLVVEAGEKSGSLITANLARKFKRKIFSVPGPIFSETAKGTNQLIKTGAEMVFSEKDILNFYKIPCFNFEEKKTIINNSGSILEKQIMEYLQREPLEIDILSRFLGIPSSKLGANLSLMEMKGLIEQDNGKYYLC